MRDVSGRRQLALLRVQVRGQDLRRTRRLLQLPEVDLQGKPKPPRTGYLCWLRVHELAMSVPAVRRRGLLAGTAFALAAAFVVWYAWPASLEAEARNVARMVVDGRARDLYRYVAPHERELAGLTEEKWEQVWRELINPRIGGLRWSGKINSWQSGGTAGADTSLEAEGGVQVPISCQVWRTDGGTKTLLLSLLTQARIAEYMREHHLSQLTPVQMIEAARRGLEKDIPVLKRLGIKGTVTADPLDGLETWDEKLRRAEQMEAELREAAQVSPQDMD